MSPNGSHSGRRSWRFFFFAVTAFMLFPCAAWPQQANQIFGICWEDVPRLVLVPEKIWVPVGCEVIDCCPGCPGPPIDWRIRLSGDPARAVVLRFENLSVEAARKLRVEGRGGWQQGNELRVEKGEVFVRGFAGDAGGPVPGAVLQIEMDESFLKARKASQASQKDSGTGKSGNKARDTVSLLIEQRIGKIVVNGFLLRYVFYPCRQLPPSTPSDRVNVLNNGTNANAAILLDGRRTGGCVNDEIFRGPASVPVNSVLAPNACNNETFVFARDSTALFLPAPAWTNPDGDLIPAPLAALLQAPVTVRTLVANTLPRANADVANANLLYNTNHAGVALQTNPAPQDLSGNVQAVNLVGAVSANMCTNAWLTALTGSAFFTAGRLNVYYVNGAFTGLTCVANTNVIVVGTTANNQTLAHEFGHSFSIDHTNGLPGFPLTNVMMGGGAGRTHFSEGQDFRVNFNTNSSLRTNGVRGGAGGRNCPDPTTSATCPALAIDAQPK